MNGMSGYLVVMRCSHDDIPLLLTAEKDKAYEFAKAVQIGDERNAEEVLSINASEVSNISVWEFECGKLRHSIFVKDFD